MHLSQSIGSILLASSFLLSGALGEGEEREIIGYRIAHEDEAAYINEHNRPYRDEIYDDYTNRNQLGHGIYMTNEPASWPAYDDEWNCVIKADSQKMKEVSKVWIPEYRREIKNGLAVWPIRLWFAEEEDILEYIESLVPEKPEQALRFSYISGLPEELQMLIPTETINKNELDFWAQCWKTLDEQLEFSSKTIEWTTDWDIVGNSGPAVEENTSLSQILEEMTLGQEE
ncbi:hypothetical protein MBM_08893 [Drepanopeziza brunnea f. sp. 'multigermtubi' MB_m1]|uniref:Uncharacterized protein n=1 Tax=Marssonina brunnea f. sp. multigermtubi (strain MB_m1) TaxID=1072389 RepID=K1XKE4_MARBU|nr:uncharacterized protein MBM_08893 [Drepanopeziza brunnea f. sp. 'multigermtubi' MB_m1]EKD12939.1 hypothetical protein MBM_08893 [Drepanopeziza brunnea f. sp. 'multigermtubi' MB_m1]